LNLSAKTKKPAFWPAGSTGWKMNAA